MADKDLRSRFPRRRLGSEFLAPAIANRTVGQDLAYLLPFDGAGGARQPSSPPPPLPREYSPPPLLPPRASLREKKNGILMWLTGRRKGTPYTRRLFCLCVCFVL